MSHCSLFQLSEKLDSIRSHAGQCLERMLTNQELPIPFVPDRSLLIEALDLDPVETPSKTTTNWAKAATTFPMVMKAADIELFSHDIISGMVISVGGMSESVTKHARAALLSWVRQAKEEKYSSRITMLGDGTTK